MCSCAHTAGSRHASWYIQVMWFVRLWVPLAIAITVVIALFYVTEQQLYRQALNDPQIQIAEDGAHALLSGAVPASLMTRGVSIDIAQSLAPWIVVYDDHGMPLESNAVLDNKPPQLPVGLFATSTWDAAKTTADGGETRLTWQPRTGVREAVVIVRAGDRFVVAGRNMHEGESRLWHLEITLGIGWLLALIATLIAVWLGSSTQDFVTIIRSE